MPEAGKISKMSKVKTEDLENKILELTDSWKRALADYQNLQRRSAEEKSNTIKLASRGLVLKLLPVLDSLEDAALHLNNDGLNLCLKMFRDALSSEGLELVETDGQEFNPETMECIDVEDGEKDNLVSQTISNGYRLNGQVIRSAKVKVTRSAASKSDTNIAKDSELK